MVMCGRHIHLSKQTPTRYGLKEDTATAMECDNLSGKVKHADEASNKMFCCLDLNCNSIADIL